MFENLADYLELSQTEFAIAFGAVFLAGLVRGFAGFALSAYPQNYQDDTVSVSVPGYGGFDLDFNFGDASLTGTAGSDTLTGNGNANSISGLGAADVIDGAGGDDVISGGNGNDILTGGTGFDVFVFEDTDFAGSDIVTDFLLGIDKLDISDYGSGSYSAVNGATGAEVSVDGTLVATLVGVDSAFLTDDSFVL